MLEQQQVIAWSGWSGWQQGGGEGAAASGACTVASAERAATYSFQLSTAIVRCYNEISAG